MEVLSGLPSIPYWEWVINGEKLVYCNWFNGTYKKAVFQGKHSFIKEIAKSSFEYLQGTIANMKNSTIQANQVVIVDWVNSDWSKSLPLLVCSL
jgi:hypothetical protein